MPLVKCRQLLWDLVAAFERRDDKRGQRFVLHLPEGRG